MYDVYLNDDIKDIYSTAYLDKLANKMKELAQKGTDSKRDRYDTSLS